MTICYDLIFPDYVRKLVEMGADFIINSTNWINDPYQRDVWGWNGERMQGLASTRALENVTVSPWPAASATRSPRRASTSTASAIPRVASPLRQDPRLA